MVRLTCAELLHSPHALPSILYEYHVFFCRRCRGVCFCSCFFFVIISYQNVMQGFANDRFIKCRWILILLQDHFRFLDTRVEYLPIATTFMYSIHQSRDYFVISCTFAEEVNGNSCLGQCPLAYCTMSMIYGLPHSSVSGPAQVVLHSLRFP